MSEDFLTWIQAALKERGWNYSELGRRIGMMPSGVSRIMSGENSPSFEFCVGVARAFKVAPEDVLRRAGLLPPLPQIDGDASIAKTLEVMKRLTPQEREEVLAYVLWRYEQQRER